jgi:hypothetical protein
MSILDAVHCEKMSNALNAWKRQDFLDRVSQHLLSILDNVQSKKMSETLNYE